MLQLCFNGDYFPAGQPLLTAQNRGFKWGDGLFETIKVWKGRLLLEDLHFERLFLGLRLLGFGSWPSQQTLARHALELCRNNRCAGQARLRLACYRNLQGGTDYIMEAEPLPGQLPQWQEPGLLLDIYPHARKSTDAFANLKSANFLPYVMARRYAEENALDETLVLNSENAIADASRANVFLVKKGEVYTPALHQGCVGGVMRRFLLDALKKDGMAVHQQQLKENDLLEADEIFLTSCIQDIRWVRSYKSRSYKGPNARDFHNRYILPLYGGA